LQDNGVLLFSLLLFSNNEEEGLSLLSLPNDALILFELFLSLIKLI